MRIFLLAPVRFKRYSPTGSNTTHRGVVHVPAGLLQLNRSGEQDAKEHAPRHCCLKGSRVHAQATAVHKSRLATTEPHLSTQTQNEAAKRAHARAVRGTISRQQYNERHTTRGGNPCMVYAYNGGLSLHGLCL